ncbi:hypothetical protein NLG97_g4712 [Lecanicillium saksenae]|uniref:Uncharacterized protein n=1 Tax=Lecanicillium saksenae TaxID=468837 RepID=A0ACC1QXP9_9HYPO|nr:hypothetical protein NLG97_g4712 [Lecanicillium saksenae]
MASLRNTVLALAVAAAQAAKVGDSSQKPIIQKHGGSTGNPLNEDLAKFIQESLDLWRVPGMAVGVIDGDNIYTEGYGYATLPDVRATADTLWYASWRRAGRRPSPPSSGTTSCCKTSGRRRTSRSTTP